MHTPSMSDSHSAKVFLPRLHGQSNHISLKDAAKACIKPFELSVANRTCAGFFRSRSSIHSSTTPRKSAPDNSALLSQIRGVVNHCAIQHCGSSEPTGHGDGCSHLRKPSCSIYVGSCSVSDRESENSRVGAQQTRNFDSALKSPISGYLDISEEEGSAQL
jgi:hypothetical protein